MPTKEWFNENPKISAYISNELYQKLEAWMIENRVKKVSQGLTKILESFFEVGQKELPVDQKFATVEQIELLQRRIEALENQKVKVVQSKPVLLKGEQLEIEPKPKNREEDLETIDEKTFTVDIEWITTKEAHNLFNEKISLGQFRRLNAKELKEKLGLEADDSKKTIGGPPSKWIKKPLPGSQDRP